MSYKIFILFVMIFVHIIEDFHLQGILSMMKQKSWWMTQAKGNLQQQELFNQKYGKDYLISLFTHSFEWAFVLMLPLVLMTNVNYKFAIIAILINSFVHAIVDDLKANQLKINLIQDQVVHYIQIVITWLLFIKIF